MEYYVDCNATKLGNGSKEFPFKRINDAAKIALAGDTVIVCPGVYRENVNPENGGKENARIVYKSLVRRGAIITGAEKISSWEKYDGNVWVVRLSRDYFGDYNPYTTYVWGDWLDQLKPCHTGEVYLNDKSLYEVTTLDEVLNPVINEESWDRDFTVYTWYTCQDEETEDVLIYANFNGANPNVENVEINARSNCFYPKKEHVDYISLEGFVVTKAATQWAPPTALQDGMIGPHWSKGWIIEDCEVSNSKCSGISLGKYKQENNDNKWSKLKFKDGSQTQRDCALIAQLDGWSKETIGSHVIRNCDIHDCGQTGIVGNLGCIFSVVENNHIHHINNKRNLAGAEIGGIKFHAPIDVIIRNNRFDHCTRGIWLDWQAQGTRVTSNIFHDNCMPHDYLLKLENTRGLGLGEDLFIEISHGPTLVDNNVFMSERAIKLPTQGVAFVHNLFMGSITAVGRGVKNGSKIYDSTRYTPIHIPHRTEIIGFMSVLHGDNRFYNNIFVQPKVREKLVEIGAEYENDEWDDCNLITGTVPFENYMTEEEWQKEFEGYCGEGSEGTRDKYYMPLPVWMEGNAFFNGAKSTRHDKKSYMNNTDEVYIKLNEKCDGKVTLDTNVTELLKDFSCSMIDSDTLGEAFEPEERFENPDGSSIVFDTDIMGVMRGERIIPGPLC